MKKVLLIAVFAVLLSSCSMISNTSSYNRFDVEPMAAVVAELNVSPTKISYTYSPTRPVRKAGAKNVIETAVKQALEKNGNADVLVALETSMTYKMVLMGRKIKSVTVTGYPAKYEDFQSMDKEYFKDVNSTKTTSRVGFLK